jgi:hypothetical protein
LKRSIHIKNLPNEKSLAKTNKDINKWEVRNEINNNRHEHTKLMEFISSQE